jgi:predicted ATPase with chaperone activity
VSTGSYISPSYALPAHAFSEPATVAELGIDRGLLLDIALKTLFYQGRMTRLEIAEAMKISSAATQELMQTITQDGLASVLGIEGSGGANYLYLLTEKGLNRAEAALGRSGYVGPAPVPLADYVTRVHLQTLAGVTLNKSQVEQALAPLVLPKDEIARIGRAASSRKSILVHGPSGNGKTTAVRAIGDAISGAMYIPYAIEMVGQIVHLYDPSKHELFAGDDAEAPEGPLPRRPDGRWVRIRRPVVWAGGELTPHSLELMYDENTKVYEAPLQLKANGGTLIIDDFGRQQMPAVALLNRWIGALEGGTDHLTLHTGQTIDVPFDVLVLFSTNLSPHDLADDAFLRRIRYKVELPNPSTADFHTIFQRECERAGIDYSHTAVTHLLDRWYIRHDRELRGCHPRDIIDAIVDSAAYEGDAPKLTPATIDEACATYFLEPMNSPE